jgi:glutamine amidotransferase
LAAEVPAVELLKMPAPTDAALLWTVLRHRLKSKPAEAAVTSLVHDVAAVAPDSRLNLLFGDGQELWATAWGHTLYTRVDESRALIVSEPFDQLPDWQQVPDRHIVCARPGHLIITPIPMGEQ